MRAIIDRNTDVPRPLREVVLAGIGWGVVFAIALPVAVGWLLLVQDTAGDGGVQGGGGGAARAPRPRRALQYAITAATTALLVGVALGIGLLVVRYHNGDSSSSPSR